MLTKVVVLLDNMWLYCIPSVDDVEDADPDRRLLMTWRLPRLPLLPLESLEEDLDLDRERDLDLDADLERALFLSPIPIYIHDRHHNKL